MTEQFAVISPLQDEKNIETLKAIWLAEAKRRDAADAAGRIKACIVDDVVSRVLARSRP